MEEEWVLGDGPEDAQVIAVGEALGTEERIHRRPFVGRAGRFLDQLCTNAGVSRTDMRITNFVKIQPERNDISPFYRAGISRAEYEELRQLGCLTYAAPRRWNDERNFTYYALTPQGMEWRRILLDELRALPGRVILALGAVSSFALTGRGGITKMRGSPLFNEAELPDKVILPTFHPASVLHGEYLARYHIAGDLRKAFRMSRLADFGIPKRTLRHSQHYTEVLDELERLRSQPLVSLDIETGHGQHITAISLTDNPAYSMSIGMIGGLYTNNQLTMIRNAIGGILMDPRVVLLGQNVIFDLFHLGWEWGMWYEGQIEDTMVLQRVFQPEMPSGLDYLCSIYTNEPWYKEDGKVASATGDLGLFLEYNAKDSAVTLEVWEKMQFIRDDPDHMKTYRFTMDFHAPLVRMMRTGLPVDAEGLRLARIATIEAIRVAQIELDTIATEKVYGPLADAARANLEGAQALYDELHEKKQGVTPHGKLRAKKDGTPILEFVHPIGKRREISKAVTALKVHLIKVTPQVEERTQVPMLLNSNSPEQLKWYFYDALGRPPYKGKDGPTVDDRAMQRLARGTRAHAPLREASLVQTSRTKRKMLGTYIDVRTDDDGRYRCVYKPKGTVTGRLASAKTYRDTGGNHQNTPPEFMLYVKSDPGCFYFEIDKSGAEWVVVAYAANEPNMIEVVKSNESPHVHTGHLMTGLDYAAIKAEAKLVKSSTDAELIARVRSDLGLGTTGWLPRTMSIRQAGKKSNHGLNYDEGPLEFASVNEISIQEAEQIVEMYHEAYPGIRRWHGRLAFQVQKRTPVRNCFGRKWKFKGFPDRELYKKAYAFVPQSTVVDAVNQGLIHIHKHLPRIALKVQRHDSIVCQYRFIDTAYFWDDIRAMAKAMTPGMEYEGHKFTIGNDLKIGSTWGGMSEVPFEREAVMGFLQDLQRRAT